MRCYSCNGQLELFQPESTVLTVDNQDYLFDRFDCLRKGVVSILRHSEGRHADNVRARATQQARLAMAARRSKLPEAWGTDPFPEGVRVLGEVVDAQ